MSSPLAGLYPSGYPGRQADATPTGHLSSEKTPERSFFEKVELFFEGGRSNPTHERTARDIEVDRLYGSIFTSIGSGVLSIVSCVAPGCAEQARNFISDTALTIAENDEEFPPFLQEVLSKEQTDSLLLSAVAQGRSVATRRLLSTPLSLSPEDQLKALKSAIYNRNLTLFLELFEKFNAHSSFAMPDEIDSALLDLLESDETEPLNPRVNSASQNLIDQLSGFFSIENDQTTPPESDETPPAHLDIDSFPQSLLHQLLLFSIEHDRRAALDILLDQTEPLASHEQIQPFVQRALTETEYNALLMSAVIQNRTLATLCLLSGSTLLPVEHRHEAFRRALLNHNLPVFLALFEKFDPDSPVVLSNAMKINVLNLLEENPDSVDTFPPPLRNALILSAVENNRDILLTRLLREDYPISLEVRREALEIASEQGDLSMFFRLFSLTPTTFLGIFRDAYLLFKTLANAISHCFNEEEV